jgi:hypothetical protein
VKEEKRGKHNPIDNVSTFHDSIPDKTSGSSRQEKRRPIMMVIGSTDFNQGNQTITQRRWACDMGR